MRRRWISGHPYKTVRERSGRTQGFEARRQFRFRCCDGKLMIDVPTVPDADRMVGEQKAKCQGVHISHWQE